MSKIILESFFTMSLAVAGSLECLDFCLGRRLLFFLILSDLENSTLFARVMLASYSADVTFMSLKFMVGRVIE